MANVVSFNRKNRPEDSATRLAECRDIALDKLSHSITAMMDKVEDELFDLADKSKSRDEQNLYLEARGLAQKQRSIIEAQFKKIFSDTFNKKISGEAAEKASYEKLEADLKLVDYDDLEEKVAVTNIATKLKSSCTEELSTLEQRIAYLLGESNLKTEDNPIGPEAICNAFKNACHELESSVKIKLVILKLFDKFVSEDVHTVYQDINQHLIQRQVLPKIRRSGVTKQPSSVNPTPVRQPALPTETQNRSSDPSISIESGNPHLPAEQDLFSTLQKLMVLSGQDTQTQTGSPTTGGSPTVSGAPVSGSSVNMPHLGNTAAATDFPKLNVDIGNANQSSTHINVINALNKLQHGEIASETLTNNLKTDSIVNIVKDIKTSGIISSTDKIDAMTIDIVAMLFDYIFEDKNISDSIKVLISKLQIPVLKVAILDKTFFSDTAHPTRQLLNTLALASIDWNNDVDKNDRLYTKINEIIQTIQKEFNEDNIDIFSTVLADLEQFLNEEAEQAEFVAERSAKVIEDIERLEIAKTKAQDEIKIRIENKGLPKSVHDFIVTHWENVLFDAYVEKGEESEAWRNSIITMENLIWSVLPMRTADDRKKLVALLPKLLKEVQEGMRLSSMSSTERDQFFTELVNCHASAVKSGLKFNGETPQAPILPNIKPNTSEAKVDTRSSEIKTAEPNFTPDNTIDLKTADEYTELAKSMQKGTWVEFNKDGKIARAKLTWVSPLKGIYLFTTREGAQAATLQLQDIATSLRKGTAKIIEDDGLLFDRAVSRLLGNLTKNTVH